MDLKNHGGLIFNPMLELNIPRLEDGPEVGYHKVKLRKRDIDDVITAVFDYLVRNDDLARYRPTHIDKGDMLTVLDKMYDFRTQKLKIRMEYVAEIVVSDVPHDTVDWNSSTELFGNRFMLETGEMDDIEVEVIDDDASDYADYTYEDITLHKTLAHD